MRWLTNAMLSETSLTQTNSMVRSTIILKQIINLFNRYRLLEARELLVNSSLPDEIESGAVGYDHTQYGYLKHRHTSDQPALSDLLRHWAHIVSTQAEESGAG